MLTIEDMDDALTEAALAHARTAGKAQALAEQAKRLEEYIEEFKRKSDLAQEAAQYLAQFADTRQQTVITALEVICSAGLQAVFGEDIKLHVRQVSRGRRPEVDITVESLGVETGILEARGGGLVAVTAFLLRVTVVLLSGAERIIIADEPFAHLSAEYSVPMAEFLKDLCLKEKLQIILVTHNMEFADVADSVVHVTKKDGKAVVEFNGIQRDSSS